MAMSVQSFALASISSTYTDSEDEFDDSTQDDYQESSPIHAIIPQNTQNPSSSPSTSDQLSTEEEVVLDNKTEEDDGLIPRALTEYPPELQERFNNYFKLSESNGLDFNAVMQNRKSFRNPSIYEKLILHCDLNESGTNFSPDVFNPFKWGKEAYYDQLDIAQQELMSKLEKSKTQTAKVEIISGIAKHPSPKDILVNENNNNVQNIVDNNNNNGSTNHTSRKYKCEFTAINFNFKKPRR